VDEKMKLKVIIFEDGKSTLNKFKEVFKFKGHDVISYAQSSSCPLFKDTQCECPKDSPCADIVIADMAMEHMTGLEFFEHQRKRGCKTPDGNKLLLVDKITAEQKREISNLGCGFIKKPINEYDFANWMERRAKMTYEGSPTMH